MLYDGEALWLASHGNTPGLGYIYKVTNPRSASPSFLQASQEADYNKLAFDGTYIYATYNASTSIRRVPVTISVFDIAYNLGSWASADASGIAFDGRTLWVAFPGIDTIRRIDPDSGEILQTLSPGAGTAPKDVMFDGEYVWVTLSGVTSTGTPSVLQIDPSNFYPGQTSLTVARDISKVSGFNAPRGIVASQSVRMGADIFVISYGDDIVRSIESNRNSSVGSLKSTGALLEGLTTITQAANPTPYKVRGRDNRVHVGTTSTAYQVDLPPFPAAGRKISVKDKARTAAARNITINGNGKNIDGAATLVMNVNGQSVHLVYDGAEWAII
jgi:hypothetical protein